MMTLTEENYLKALFHLSVENPEVSVLDLSKSLDIKMPTVNSMVKKLASKGQVRYEKYKPLQLTEEGRRSAGLIIRKHRLVEMFLVEKMGFGWDEVHEVAEQLEHIRSPKLFRKIDEILNHPKTDPHGSPIPDEKGEIAVQNFVTLSEGSPGILYRFMAVGSSDDRFLRQIDRLGFKLGDTIRILETMDFDHSQQVIINEQIARSFSQQISANIRVVPA
ncbi:MAG: metal-dependent transcriptional regulator [Leadbetterella sp.]|nr:metal-dependent transcriptional regulator [Leadbetterella sp.]